MHLSSLLGTRYLLQIVLRHYFSQRVARLQLLAECLRIEQDESSPHSETASSTLDALDLGFTVNDRCRELFHRLLHVACAPHQPPTRDELLRIRRTSQRHLQKDDVASSTFVADCIEATRRQALQEREEAMELSLCCSTVESMEESVVWTMRFCFSPFSPAIPSLLMSPADVSFAILREWSVPESMSLWYTTASDSSSDGDIPSWLSRHPMFDGIRFDSGHLANLSQ